MARKVFFSFHYKRDVRRVAQVRNSWVVRPDGDSQPFLDKAEWETIKRSGDTAVKSWIEKQLTGTSVLVVLIGLETYDREWVRYEIKRAYELKKGILGIYIHNIKDPSVGTDTKGKNPLDYWGVGEGAQRVTFSKMYKTYDWVNDDGYNNLPKWIEEAAKAVGR